MTRKGVGRIRSGLTSAMQQNDVISDVNGHMGRLEIDLLWGLG